MSYLNQPLKVKNVTFKNRLVMPPMATSKSDGAGMVTQELCEYYNEKSRGGHFGLIITEHSFISPEGKASANQLSVSNPSCVNGLSELAAVIHKNGSAAIAQINHAGRQTTSEITGAEIVGVSAIPAPPLFIRLGKIPRVLSTGEISAIVQNFAKSARYVREAGFDGVEIHSAHGYLLNQFYSPLANKRDDMYTGATIEGRCRIHLEVIRAVREAVGEDFIIALRLGASDYAEGGSTGSEGVLAAKLFEEAGVDILDITGGLCGFMPEGKTGQGYFAQLSRPIKEAVKIPVILTGGVTDAAGAENLLGSSAADLIGVGRAVLKDSGWARRALNSL
ncbi:MAG: NADH:flavin oxidoreductase [Clostridiales bacterium]|jgi:2,4-dienoyl-CoA reductase-like NADH-dependent reductase (Old Yellow Enzyme family)|nr:NADH:flavin oxidoreductase [Clostridiales bacterium]